MYVGNKFRNSKDVASILRVYIFIHKNLIFHLPVPLMHIFFRRKIYLKSPTLDEKEIECRKYKILESTRLAGLFDLVGFYMSN